MNYHFFAKFSSTPTDAICLYVFILFSARVCIYCKTICVIADAVNEDEMKRTGGSRSRVYFLNKIISASLKLLDDTLPPHLSPQWYQYIWLSPLSFVLVVVRWPVKWAYTHL